ncbi:MAG: tetratricopeptide repeat protein [Planctomycetes bacterium]|nr:tetratricopeptide repeat protein [Planctomycetota bacterium]
MSEVAAARSPRCYSCGRPADRASDLCAGCGAGFLQLCACGSSTFFDESACGWCGSTVTPRRFDVSRSRRKKIARWVLGVATVGGLAFATSSLWRPQPIEPWRLKETAGSAYDSGDRRTALRLMSEVTEATPRDARAWLVRGLCEHDLGLDPELALGSMKRALELEPTSREVARAYASTLLATGRAAAAAQVAERALEVRGGDATLLRIAGQAYLSIQPPRPLDAARALAAARAAGDVDPALVILQAVAAVAAYGEIPADLRSAELDRALADADAALTRVGSAPFPALLSPAVARLHIVLGRPATALALAEDELQAADGTATPARRAITHLLAGRAALLMNEPTRASSHFAAALAERPDLATASEVLDVGERCDRASLTMSCVTSAAAKSDPQGDLRLALAGVAMRDGTWSVASAHVAPLLAMRPDDPTVLLLAADLRRAEGRIDEAEVLLRHASAQGAKVAAAVRLAFLQFRPDVPAAERTKAIESALAEIRPLVESRDDASPDDWAALASLSLARGRTTDAAAQAARAVRGAPGRADLQCLLASASAAVGTPAAWTDAARAISIANALRPRLQVEARTQVIARFAAGDPIGASALASAALQKKPDDEELLAVRARCARMTGDWRSAAADLRRLLDLARKPDPATLVFLIEALLLSSDAAGADAVADRFRGRLAPEHQAEVDAVLAGHMPGRSTDAVSVERARQLFDAGNVDGAVGMSRAILTSKPGDPAASLVAIFAILEGRETDAERFADARRIRAAMTASRVAGVTDLVDGRILLAEGRSAEAVDALRRATASAPDEPVARYLLGEALFRSGDVRLGLEDMRVAAARTDPDSPIRRRVSDRLVDAAAAGTVDEREGTVLGAMKLDRTNPRAADAWIVVLFRRGAFDEAESAAEAFLANSAVGDDWAIRMRWSAVAAAFAAGRPDRAQQLLVDLPPEQSDSALAWVARGSMRLRSQDIDGALQAFERAQRIAPDDDAAMSGVVAALLQLGREDDAARRVDAWCRTHDGERVPLAFAAQLAQRGRADAALARVRALRDARPTAEAPARHLAALLAQSGRPDDAIADARAFEASATAAQRARSELFRAQIAVASGIGTAEAKEIARRATGPEARVLESEVLSQSGEDADAERVATAVIAELGTGARPLRARASFVLGCTAIRANRPEEAARCFLSSLDLNPSNAAAANNLAWIWSSDKQAATRALEMANRAVKLAPKDPNSWDTLGVCAHAAGDGRLAEQAWRTSLDLGAAQTHAPARLRGATGLRLARYLVAKLRRDEAREVAAAVVAAVPGTEMAAEAAKIVAGTN